MEIAENRSQKYKLRMSYLHQIKHINDNLPSINASYKGKMFKAGTSTELWNNPMQNGHYMALESLLYFLVESVKSIKLHFSIAHDKNSINIE